QCHGGGIRGGRVRGRLLRVVHAMSSSAGAASSSAGQPDLALQPTRGFLAELGATGVELARTGFGLYSLFVRTLYYCFRGRREPGAVTYYMYEIGNRSLFFLTVVMGFIGMIMVYQGGTQTQRVIPDL